ERHDYPAIGGNSAGSAVFEPAADDPRIEIGSGACHGRPAGGPISRPHLVKAVGDHRARQAHPRLLLVDYVVVIGKSTGVSEEHKKKAHRKRRAKKRPHICALILVFWSGKGTLSVQTRTRLSLFRPKGITTTTERAAP